MPPDVVGNAVPDKLIANVPLVVMGEPAIDKNDGTLAATLVTVPNGFDAHDVSVPSVVRYLPLFPVWLGAKALKAALAVVCPVPPLRIGKVPVTPVVKGKPVALVNVTDVGVPSKGVTNVGLVANTKEPEPVSSVVAVANCADVNEPKDVALPTEVIAPVKLALVVTLPAVSPAAVPVIFVPTKAEGVPNAGVTRVGLVANTSDPVPVSSVTAASKLALDGVAKNVATPVPKPLTPVLIGKPVALVSVADCGVPRIGVTKVGDVLNTKLVDVVPVAPEAV